MNEPMPIATEPLPRYESIFNETQEAIAALDKINVLLNRTYGGGLTDMPHIQNPEIQQALRTLRFQLAYLQARAGTHILGEVCFNPKIRANVLSVVR